MATLLDSPVTFFAKATPEQFAYVLGQYREVFAVHAQETRGSKKNGPAELIKLDNWFQEQLPQIIKSRKDQQLIYDEIVQITKWKLLRGKFKPGILDLVRTNTETAVKNVTKKAFKKMPNINAAITALTQLKGIAPATASAILVAHSSDLCPYMAEENMAATPGVEESDLSISEYLNYVEQTNLCVERLRAQDAKTGWTPHKVELAMWTLYQAKQYNSNLLDNLPDANQSAVQCDENVNEESVDNEVQTNGDEHDNGVNDELNSNESDENSNQSIEQQSADEQSESNYNKPNGHYINGNGIHEEESNLSEAAASVVSENVSSENEDKSNDSSSNKEAAVSSTVDNSNDQADVQQLAEIHHHVNENNNVEVERENNVEVLENNVVAENNVVSESSNIVEEEQNKVESTTTNVQSSSNEEMMEVVTSDLKDDLPQEEERIVEELSNHHLNNQINDNQETSSQQITSNQNVEQSNDNATDHTEHNNHVESNHVDSNNHCNGLKNGINNVLFSKSLKENLISSSEENSNNNLSEENSNLSNSNLSYTDLHSNDNAIDDGPALKRIRVE